MILEIEQQAKEFDALLKGVSGKKPKPEAVTAFRAYLDAKPELWRVAGNLTKAAQDNILDALFGEKWQGISLSVKKGMELKRAELGYNEAPALEQLLIEHLITCWLHLQEVELKYHNVTKESIPLTVGDYWERRLSATQRRYLRACETLARVRRLLRPTIQVNVAAEGGQQVNIAGDVGVKRP